MPHNPQHARRRFSLRRATTRVTPELELVQPAASAVTWAPLPLDAADVSSQARRELSAIARKRQDLWAGTRDTDRSL